MQRWRDLIDPAAPYVLGPFRSGGYDGMSGTKSGAYWADMVRIAAEDSRVLSVYTDHGLRLVPWSAAGTGYSADSGVTVTRELVATLLEDDEYPHSEPCGRMAEDACGRWGKKI